MAHPDVVIVLTTWPAGEDAGPAAATLVEERLAACVNLLPEMESIYRWKNAVEQERERQMVIKTTRLRVDDVAGAAQAASPVRRAGGAGDAGGRGGVRRTWLGWGSVRRLDRGSEDPRYGRATPRSPAPQPRPGAPPRPSYIADRRSQDRTIARCGSGSCMIRLFA